MPFTVAPITGFTTDIPFVCIGGSVTQATQVAAAYRWVDLLGRYIGTNTYHHISMYNSGVGGNNAWMDLVRIQAGLLDYNPSIVLIDCAVNNVDSDSDKASTEALVRLVRTSCPNAYIFFINFGYYLGFATNDYTNSSAANIVYINQLATNYDVGSLDFHSHLVSLVDAGSYTVGQYTEDAVHPTIVGNNLIFEFLKTNILQYFPLPVTPQWTQDLSDYTRLFDNGDYENTPIIRTAIDNEGEMGTWSVVNTTQNQSTAADSTISWTGTFQSFGLDLAITGGVAWNIDGGDFTTINFSLYPIANMRYWSGARAEHTVTIKVVSGTVTIKRFLAV